MKFLNSYKSRVKQGDKLEINLRFGKLTLLELTIDISRREYRFLLLNIGFRSNTWTKK